MKSIYRYGAIAWIWRILLAGALCGAAGLLGLGIHFGTPIFFLLALILAGPSLFFGGAVATQIDLTDDGRLRVETLIFWRRHLTSEQIGRTRLRKRYETETGSIYAPAVWVRVRGGWPIYLDLLGHIPDRSALAKTFRVPLREIPGRNQEDHH